MPTKKKRHKDFVEALSDFIQGKSPEGLHVYKYNKSGKLVEVINEDSLELIRDENEN